MEFVFIFIGGIIIYSVISLITAAPGRSLQNKFVGMGVLSGKSKNEIISIVGPPNSISELPNGKSLLQWMTAGYHIAIIFNGEICESISHEFASS